MKRLFLIICTMLFLVGCNSSQNVVITIETPYILDSGLEGISQVVDLGITPRSLKVVNSLNSNDSVVLVLEDGKVFYNIEQNQTPKVIDPDLLNYFGQPVTAHQFTIEAEVKKSDLSKLEENFPNFNKNVLNAKNMAILHLDNPYFAMERVLEPILLEGELKDNFPRLQEMFNEMDQEMKKMYFEKDTTFKQDVKNIVTTAKTGHEKARRFIEKMENINSTNGIAQENINVLYLRETGEGTCRSIAYMIKLSLDEEGVKNRIVTGMYNDNGQKIGHMINGVWSEEKQEWLYFDGTTKVADKEIILEYFTPDSILDI